MKGGGAVSGSKHWWGKLLKLPCSHCGTVALFSRASHLLFVIKPKPTTEDAAHLSAQLIASKIKECAGAVPVDEEPDGMVAIL